MVSGKTLTILTSCMISLPSAGHLSIAYLPPSLVYHPAACKLAALVLTPLFCLLALYFLWCAAVSDPGFVPLTERPPVVCVSEPSKPPASFLKLCNTCNVYRPVRAHHCRTCNRCVFRHDHHCPWINNCVGRGNHRCFLLLLLTCLAESVEVIGELLAAMLEREAEAVALSVETALLVYSGVMLWSVGALLGYQLYLVSTNQTTNEHIRHIYLKNPFNAGFIPNCTSFWRRDRLEEALDSARDATQMQEIKT